MITAYEQSDLIHIMKMNRLSLADSDSAQMEFTGQFSGKDYSVKVPAVESSPQLIIKEDGEVVCNETLRSIDDLKIFLEERLYQFFVV